MEKTESTRGPFRKDTICGPRVSCLGSWVRFPRSMLKEHQMEDKPLEGEGIWFTTELLFCSTASLGLIQDAWDNREEAEVLHSHPYFSAPLCSTH